LALPLKHNFQRNKALTFLPRQPQTSILDAEILSNPEAQQPKTQQTTL
jgi:hypothetical protein